MNVTDDKQTPDHATDKCIGIGGIACSNNSIVKYVRYVSLLHTQTPVYTARPCTL